MVYHGYITVWMGWGGMGWCRLSHLIFRLIVRNREAVGDFNWMLVCCSCVTHKLNQLSDADLLTCADALSPTPAILLDYNTCFTRQNNDPVVFIKTTVSDFTQRNYTTHLIMFLSHDLLPHSYARMSPQSMPKPPDGFSRPGRGPPWFRRGSEGWW